MPKILIVKDDGLVQAALKINLEDSGFEVCSALTIEEARDIFPTQAWDLIAMDACVPGDRVNTENLVAEFRKTFSGPIVAISTMNEYNDKLIEAGCSHKCGKYKLTNFIRNFLAEQK